MFTLDPGYTFLNHGSFGACPRFIQEKQQQYRAEMEAEPVAFLTRELEPRYQRSLETLAGFIGSDTADLAFVPNATYGINTVLKSIPFAAGDEVVITNHIYGACRVVLAHLSALKGIKVIEIPVPFPSPETVDFVSLVLASLSKRTRLVFLDHVTSPTALIFPIKEIAAALDGLKIDLLVDGAHAPGAIQLNINELNIPYYTGNCHKWMCAPKSVGFLHVRADRQAQVHALVHSHFSGAGRPFPERFFWTGTMDPTPALCVHDVIRYFEQSINGGWEAFMRGNHGLIVQARKYLCDGLGIPLPCPDEMISTMAAIPLGIPGQQYQVGHNEMDELQQALFVKHKIEVPVFSWNQTRILRPSAQVYNNMGHYNNLLAALQAEGL